ncbi:hypothetical protein SAMN05216428_10339 [Nitrosospira sp. Nsp11]|nr:hypothetical protein SAMN05216428_10339 [Nitrosospira sp. Nsp11]
MRLTDRLSGRTMHSWYSCRQHNGGRACDLDRAYSCLAKSTNSISIRRLRLNKPTSVVLVPTFARKPDSVFVGVRMDDLHGTESRHIQYPVFNVRWRQRELRAALR